MRVTWARMPAHLLGRGRLAGLAGTAIALACGPAGLEPAAAASATKAAVSVNDTPGLLAALKVATAGETIALKGGLYTGVAISNLNFETPVTITSADPTHPAVLVGLNMTSSSGLTFTNLNLTTAGPAGQADPYYAFRITNSSNLAFTHLNVHGDLSTAPAKQITGFLIQNSSNISITQSSFTHLLTAIGELNNNHLTIGNNAFTDMATDAIDNAGSSYVTIADNNFTDFSTPTGTHSDCIQFWTTNVKTVTDNITISGNVYDRGNGAPVQGIFLNDEGHTGYKDVTISNNTMIGGAYHGIYLKNATGQVNVQNNTVATWAGPNIQSGATQDLYSWIALTDVSGAKLTETGNRAQEYLLDGKKRSTPAGNTRIGAVTDKGAALMTSWATAHSSALPSLSTDLISALGLNTRRSTVGIAQ